MKFDHRVNFNGVYYIAGEEVPMEQVEEPVPTPAPEEVVAPEVKTEEDAPKRRRRPSRER